MIEGTVHKGSMMGRKIGFPTINVSFDRVELPFGVYGAKVQTPLGTFKGALHFGPRHVINSPEALLEVYLLDFAGDIYNKKVIISVFDKIRDTANFDSLDSLKKQIHYDVEAVRALPIFLN